MNKKGSIFIGIVLGIFIWVAGILLIPFVVDDIDTTRTSLDCTNSTISDGTKLNCLNVDLVIPIFIWLIISMVVGIFMGSFK